MPDHVAACDQWKARIDHTRSIVLGSWIQVSFARDRSKRQLALIDRSIERLARSRIRLAESRRTLARL